MGRSLSGMWQTGSFTITSIICSFSEQRPADALALVSQLCAIPLEALQLSDTAVFAVSCNRIAYLPECVQDLFQIASRQEDPLTQLHVTVNSANGFDWTSGRREVFRKNCQVCLQPSDYGKAVGFTSRA